MHSKATIDRYLAGSLSPHIEDRLRSHLTGCLACRQYFEEQIVLLRSLAGNLARPTVAEEDRVLRRALAGAGLAAPESAGRSTLLDRLRARPIRFAALIAALLILFLAGVIWMSRARSPQSSRLVFVPPAAVPSQPVQAARLTTAKRTAIDGKPTRVGSVVFAGVPVEVTAGGVAEATLNRGGRVRVLSRSQAIFSAQGQAIELKAGKVWSKVDNHSEPFRVRTDHGEARALSATFIVERTAAGETEVRVVRGSVEVEDGQHRGVVQVKRGQETHLRSNAPPSPARRYVEDRDPDCPIEGLFK